MASTELGPACAKAGLTGAVLLSYVPSAVGSGSRVCEVSQVSNRLLIELLQFKDQHIYRTMYRWYWLQDLFGENCPTAEAPTLQAFTKSIER